MLEHGARSRARASPPVAPRTHTIPREAFEREQGPPKASAPLRKTYCSFSSLSASLHRSVAGCSMGALLGSMAVSALSTALEQTSLVEPAPSLGNCVAYSLSAGSSWIWPMRTQL